MGRTATLSRQQRKEDRRAAILAAARAAFAARGYAGSSIPDIARASGIADGTIYKYFPSKQALLFEVMRQFYEALIAEVEAGIAACRGLRDSLRHIVDCQLRAFAQNEDLCRLFIRELRTADDYPDSPLHRLNRRYTSIVVRTLETGMAAGEARADTEPRLVRDLLYGAIEHIAWARIGGARRWKTEAITDQLVEIVLHGVAPAAKRTRKAGGRT